MRLFSQWQVRALVRSLAVGLFMVLGWTGAAFAGYGKTAVPPSLAPWQAWVMQGQAGWQCPFSPQSFDLRECVWPTSLFLAIDAKGAFFRGHWRLYEAGYVALPGDEKAWPRDVAVGESAAPLIDLNGKPAIHLAAGEYEITGRFAWERMPDYVQVPTSIALLQVERDGKAVNFPSTDAEGRFWLREPQAETGGGKAELASSRQEDQLNLRVYRHLIDEVPFEVETLIEVEVSGKPREQVLGPALLAGYTLQSFQAPLPARLDADGQLRVQLRPGSWQFRISGYKTQAVTTIAAPAATAPWPDQEIWVFEPRPELRTVRVENATSLDPTQTSLPAGWRDWQAWQILPEQSLQLKELRRGNPDPSPNELNLTRSMWLDFSGKGWTVRDDVVGQIHRGWRLQAEPELALGEVTVNGQPRVITQRGRNDAQSAPSDNALVKGALGAGALMDGVELREAQLNLRAVSRIDAAKGDTQALAPRSWSLPVGGWWSDFQGVSAQLHLPPGWRLFTAVGVDNAAPTWVGGWSVWDVFLLLIATAALGRVLGKGVGVVGFFMLALVYPEAPTLLFMLVNLLAALALLRRLAAGRLRAVIGFYARASALVLVVAVIAFAVTQARYAVYPQLQHANLQISNDSDGSATMNEQALAPEMADPALPAPPVAVDAAQPLGAVRERSSMPYKSMPYGLMASKRTAGAITASVTTTIDPQQAAQTGPGLPSWYWDSVTLAWHGPVVQDQRLTLYLMGPLENRLLALLRIVLIGWVLLVLFSRFRSLFSGGSSSLQSAATPSAPIISATQARSTLAGLAWVVIGLTGMGATVAPNHAVAATVGEGFPNNEMLEALRGRLWGERNCTPACLGVEAVQVQIDGLRLNLHLSVSAQEEVELLLPDSQQQWLPQTVAMNGDTSVAAMRRDGNRFYVVAPKGASKISVSGPLQRRDSFQLSFPYPVHNVATVAPNWNVDGVENGVLRGGALLFAPEVVERDQPKVATLVQEAAPPLVRITRQLQLGLTWQVTTRVERIAPRTGAIVLDVPLLTGESLLSRELEVQGGKVRVALSANQPALEWVSRLEIAPELDLLAATGSAWLERWQFEIAPLWHVGFEGLAPIASENLPTWQPVFVAWPGEKLRLQIEKPVPRLGQTSTIDRVQLEAYPGARESRYRLHFQVRTSKGGEHGLVLPEAARLTELSLDGQALAFSEVQHKVNVQIAPGVHQIIVGWRGPEEMLARWHTPQLVLGQAGVDGEPVARNVTLDVQFPENRWILWVGGPAVGPAVLFWGLAFVLVLISFVLGRLPQSPLRGWQWALLALGFASGAWQGLIVVALWFLALAWRAHWPAAVSDARFNFVQIGLVLLTIVALGAFLEAIPTGLLGTPDMGIVGNGSYGSQLYWYQDAMGQALPSAWVVSVPLWVYRGLMLLWALWVAIAMLKWLPWAWQAWSTQGYWRSTPRPARPNPARSRDLRANDPKKGEPKQGDQTPENHRKEEPNHGAEKSEEHRE
ncbi:Conserved hypothetical protein [gamma proteobacterium HdN1]|nr:Conserved hypothetical protein [gamma proteobacterium HdN1]